MVAAWNDRHNEPSLNVMVSDVADEYAEALRILLAPHGFVIRRVPTGRDAIWLAEQRAVDAAVLDTELPDMPGVRAARVIRSLRITIPIILVGRTRSPNDQEHLLRTALDLEAFSVLAQPVDLELLLGQMARLFERLLGLPDGAGQQSAGEPSRPEPARFNGRQAEDRGQSSSPSDVPSKGRRVLWFGRRG